LQIIGLILAAGQGKRMKSKLYKVLHPVCGKPMLGHVMDTLEKVQVDRNVVVVGHGAETVQAYLGDRADYVLQPEQLGTGHAVIQAKSLLQDEDGILIVVCGDTPLVRESSLLSLIQLHREKGAVGTILTARLEKPQGYGRIIRSERGDVSRIVEQKDCSSQEDQVQEINTGTYCFDNRKLFKALEKVNNKNKQQEYYLTDVIGILREQGEEIQAHCLEDHQESTGVNDRLTLAAAEQAMRQRINQKHLLNGVSIIDPTNTYIEADVVIGMDTTIYPGTSLCGTTAIGMDCHIGPHTEITDSLIGDDVKIKQSVLQNTVIGDQSTVGPFANLRPGTKLGKGVKIGDFVEIKNASIHDGSKVSHLSYVGDAKVGKNVNIGCGAITVNYDGFRKHHTEIEDDAFIGSNVNLIAPIKIGRKAFVVAGSTITQEVKENSLAIARTRQTNKPDYADKLRNRFKASGKDENRQ
jgi:bifunctional UDP-N-acetylglucosamine pyrophosphorylase/glucosamine-1-phosphate N-acetyltransferase